VVVDSGVVPFLAGNWKALLRSENKEGLAIYIHDRENFSLRDADADADDKSANGSAAASSAKPSE